MDEGGSAHWRREPAPSIDPSTDTIYFQQLELDHYLDRAMDGMLGPFSLPTETPIDHRGLTSPAPLTSPIRPPH